MDQNHFRAKALNVPQRRISRFGRLSGMTAGIAGSMALNGAVQLSQGQRPSMRDLLLTPQNIHRITDQLAKMRGAAMKIGQLMSMDSGDFLPPELATIMDRLRKDAHFMPPAQLKKVLNDVWPCNWLKSFDYFNVRPIAAASIGQVHRARLKDGRELAIKVQYPGIAKSIDSDVANVGTLMRMSGLLPKAFDLTPYLDEACKQLHAETDYVREGAQLERFGARLANMDQFLVPDLHRDWSTPSILSMSFAEGIPIEDVQALSQDIRDRVVGDLIDLTMSELFTFGVMQTDPNFANYLYQADSQRVVLLDFGATLDIETATVERYRRLLRAGFDDDAESLSGLAVENGFVGPETRDVHKTQIIEMMRLAFARMRGQRPFDFAHDALARDLHNRGLKLAESGFVPSPLPIDVLLLQRKLGGIFLLARRLRAQVDIVERLQPFLT